MQDDDCAGDDIVRTHPLDCKAMVPGHRRSYSFTNLVPLFGFRACSGFRMQWEKLYREVNEETTFNEYRMFTRMLRDIGLANEDSKLFQQLSSCKPPTQKHFQKYLDGLRKRILDPNDVSFTNAGRSSVVKYLETLRNCLRRFSHALFFPEMELSMQGMYGDDGEVQTPCFATIAIEAGRLKLDADNDHDNAVRFHVSNRDLLDALRSSLVEVFTAGQEMFAQGERLLKEHDLPPVAKLVGAIKKRATLQGANARGERGLAALLDGSADYVRAVALLLFKRFFYRKQLPFSRQSMQTFIKSAGGVEFISKLAEPSNDTLMAATTIVQIDTGWESATVLNMDLDPFVGTVKKNSVTIRALVSRKNRARGKPRNSALIDNGEKDEEPDNDMNIPMKLRGEITGYQVICSYREMTTEMRKEFPPARRKKLWLSRDTLPLNSLVYFAFQRFLGKISEHPILGGLPLTRRSIKRTKYNVDANSTIGNIGLARARGDHSNDRLAFAYLSAPAVRALFKHKIREYIEQFDAVAYSSIDDLATKLGIARDILDRRKILGLENGLSELLHGPKENSSAPTDDFATLAKTLKPDDQGLKSLVVAGFSIDARWEDMSTKNPSRFLRTWVPWMALIQAMVKKIMKTRHRAKFRRVFEEVRNDLAAGTLSLVPVW